VNEREIWFFGKSAYYQWDGKDLRRGPALAPYLTDVWTSRSGEIWIVGSDGPRHKSAPGRAFRAVAPGGSRP